MIRISPSCLKTIRLPSGANLGSSSRVPSFSVRLTGFRPAVHLPKVDIPRIAAMLASRDSHEDDLLAVRGEIAVDGVVDLPAFAEASEPLRREIVEIEAAVPCVVIRIAVEEDSATKLRSGVGRVRGLVASAAPCGGGCGLASESRGTHTQKICPRHRRARSAVAENIRFTRLADYLMCARGRGNGHQDHGVYCGASKRAHDFHSTVPKVLPTESGKSR